MGLTIFIRAGKSLHPAHVLYYDTSTFALGNITTLSTVDSQNDLCSERQSKGENLTGRHTIWRPFFVVILANYSYLSLLGSILNAKSAIE